MRKNAISALVLLCLLTVGIVSGESVNVQAQTNIATSVSITTFPNQVQVGDYTVLSFQISPPPPGPLDQFTNITITFTSSNGTTIPGPYNTYWTSSGTGKDYFHYYPTSIGTWTLTLNFPGQTFSNGANYLPSEAETVLTVIPTSLLPTPTPRPTTATIVNGDTIIEGNPHENVTILSPENKVYNTENVTVSFDIESTVPPLDSFTGTLFDPYFRYGCFLDYNTQTLISEKPMNIDQWNPHKPGFIPNSSANLTLFGHGDGWQCNGTLRNLSQGTHQLTVWIDEELNYISTGHYVGSVFSTVSFTVDSIPPNVTIISPESQIYNVSDVPLNFTVNKTFTQISYSLDGLENISAIGNVTLTDLSSGSHNVTVYAADKAGNIGSSQITNFTVELPSEASEEHSATITVAVVIGVIALVVVVALLVYLKKHRRAV